MTRFVLRRLGLLIPTLFGISVLVFALMHLVPGDPAAMVGAEADGAVAANVDATAQIEGFRKRYLFDQPLWKQYLHYVGPFSLASDGHEWFGGSGRDPWNGLLVLDFGNEFLRPQVEVGSELLRRLAITLPLTALAILLAYLLSIPLGIYSAVKSGSVFDKSSAAFVFAMYALPTFWVGLLLQWAFGRTGLDWLPTIGLASTDAAELDGAARFLDRAAHLVLPVTCYAVGSLAYLSRQMRVGMIEVLGEDYVRMARAKGLSEYTVVSKHAFRNSLLPLVTLFATVLPALVGGSVVVETVFDIPGMGLYVYESLLRREYNAIMAAVLIGSLTTVAGLVCSDILYAWIDPRIRLSGRRTHG